MPKIFIAFLVYFVLETNRASLENDSELMEFLEITLAFSSVYTNEH